MTGAETPLLTLEHVGRSFGGVHAADDVSIRVTPGSIHGLIGPNGAGKTTVLNLISGLLRVDTGVIRLGKTQIQALSPHRIVALGVRRTFQNIRLFGSMSVLDNVIVGMHSVRRDAIWRRLFFSRAVRDGDQLVREQATAVLRRVGIGDRAERRASDLPYGEQRRLEIARAICTRPRLLLLDEPTAGMSGGESAEVAALIRSLAAGGTAVLLVEHNVELVMRVADAITVLDFGQVIADGMPEAVRRDPAVIEAYLGTEE